MGHFYGALRYADDLMILAPSPDALRKMLAHREEYAGSHGIPFHASKTQLICFRRTSVLAFGFAVTLAISRLTTSSWQHFAA